MAQKSMGHVELEWVCPNCGSRNPGSAKQCSSCFASQPEDVEFVQAAEDKIITDEEKLAKAESGPDIHCAYCGTRNNASNSVCTQCGAPLGEGKAREAGQVLGSHRDKAAKDVVCPACGTSNSADTYRCTSCGTALKQEAKPKQAAAPAKVKGGGMSRYIVAGVLVMVFMCVAIFLYLSLSTEEQLGEVAGVQWERTIGIEEERPVEDENWRDNVPARGNILSCEERLFETQSTSAPGAVEVCGTPYTVDQGNGFGEVVQDCQYEIYEDWCTYTTLQWQEVDEARLTGNDYNPQWPTFNLRSGQREGEREESYTVQFRTDGDQYNYTFSDASRLSQYQVGSDWILEINGFGSVTGTTAR
ncbi:MAG TPA: zinc finger protein [Anaerolineae bacterium]|nr:zinc finger protein [Anaerolineae bacterium]